MHWMDRAVAHLHDSPLQTEEAPLSSNTKARPIQSKIYCAVALSAILGGGFSRLGYGRRIAVIGGLAASVVGGCTLYEHVVAVMARRQVPIPVTVTAR